MPKQAEQYEKPKPAPGRLDSSKTTKTTSSPESASSATETTRPQLSPGLLCILLLRQLPSLPFHPASWALHPLKLLVTKM